MAGRPYLGIHQPASKKGLNRVNFWLEQGNFPCIGSKLAGATLRGVAFPDWPLAPAIYFLKQRQGG